MSLYTFKFKVLTEVYRFKFIFLTNLERLNMTVFQVLMYFLFLAPDFFEKRNKYYLKLEIRVKGSFIVFKKK